MDTDEMRLALIKARDRSMAEVLTIWIGIASELHPELLRNAIGKVFDIRAVEDDHRRLAQELGVLRSNYEQARILLEDLHIEIERQEKRRDVLIAQLDHLERKVKRKETA